MNINKIANYAVSTVQEVATKAVSKITKEVPKSDLPANYWDAGMPWEVFEAKKNLYLKKLYATYFDENGKVIPEVKKFLDETVFNLETGGGKNVKQSTTTLKNYISSSIHDTSTIKGELFHGALRPEPILEEGFNPKYISRTNLGPGFYFAGEGEAREYGTVIAAKIKDSGATVARADDRFYEGILGGDVGKKLADFLGFKYELTEESRIQNEFMSKIINEYSRDFIVNELGIDVLQGYGGATPFDHCTCVLNLDIFDKIYKH